MCESQASPGACSSTALGIHCAVTIEAPITDEMGIRHAKRRIVSLRSRTQFSTRLVAETQPSWPVDRHNLRSLVFHNTAVSVSMWISPCARKERRGVHAQFGPHDRFHVDRPANPLGYTRRLTRAAPARPISSDIGAVRARPFTAARTDPVLSVGPRVLRRFAIVPDCRSSPCFFFAMSSLRF